MSSPVLPVENIYFYFFLCNTERLSQIHRRQGHRQQSGGNMARESDLWEERADSLNKPSSLFYWSPRCLCIFSFTPRRLPLWALPCLNFFNSRMAALWAEMQSANPISSQTQIRGAISPSQRCIANLSSFPRQTSPPGELYLFQAGKGCTMKRLSTIVFFIISFFLSLWRWLPGGRLYNCQLHVLIGHLSRHQLIKTTGWRQVKTEVWSRIRKQTFVTNQLANMRKERVNWRESFLWWRPFFKCSGSTSNQPSGNLIEASHWVLIFLFCFIWPDWLDFPEGIQEY